LAHTNVNHAWAERAKAAGYPERYAQVNLGHNSKAMTRAYSRKAEVEMPSLSEYERQQKAIIGNHETESVTQSVAA
jgi:integrase